MKQIVIQQGRVRVNIRVRLVLKNIDTLFVKLLDFVIYIDPCPVDNRKQAYERGYLLDESGGNLYVCMLSNIE